MSYAYEHEAYDRYSRYSRRSSERDSRYSKSEHTSKQTYIHTHVRRAHKLCLPFLTFVSVRDTLIHTETGIHGKAATRVINTRKLALIFSKKKMRFVFP